MIQPNLYPLHFSHNFSTDLIKETVVRYQTHPLGESSVKMECLQTVQIKGCGLTVLEPDIFSQYLIFLVIIQNNQKEGGFIQRCKYPIEPTERNHLEWGLVRFPHPHWLANWCCHCVCVCYATMLLRFHGYSFPT